MATIGAFAILLDDDGRVLCVRQNYPPREWTLPGGRVKPNESPLAALHREIMEETGCRIAIERHIGTYARIDADDLVLLFAARILERAAWAPNGEIADLGFFAPAALPQPMNGRHRQRIEDAVDGRSGLVRVYDSPDRLLESFLP
jgi:ADP-ribose pyrophosphatase YjhB (NUDIX family)